jgi:hypothetical protein
MAPSINTVQHNMIEDKVLSYSTFQTYIIYPKWFLIAMRSQSSTSLDNNMVANWSFYLSGERKARECRRFGVAQLVLVPITELVTFRLLTSYIATLRLLQCARPNEGFRKRWYRFTKSSDDPKDVHLPSNSWLIDTIRAKQQGGRKPFFWATRLYRNKAIPKQIFLARF